MQQRHFFLGGGVLLNAFERGNMLSTQAIETNQNIFWCFIVETPNENLADSSLASSIVKDHTGSEPQYVQMAATSCNK